MTHRFVPLLITVLVIPVMMYGLLQYWPVWVSTAVGLGTLGLAALLLRAIFARQPQSSRQSPELEARVAASLDRIGLEHLIPRVVDGQGDVIVRIVGGTATVSLEAEQYLTDAELDALLLKESRGQPAFVRHEAFRYVPWVLVLVMVVSWALSVGRRPAGAAQEVQRQSENTVP